MREFIITNIDKLWRKEPFFVKWYFLSLYKVREWRVDIPYDILQLLPVKYICTYIYKRVHS